MTCPMSCDPRAMAACWRGEAWSRSSPAKSATADPSFATCATASMSSSRGVERVWPACAFHQYGVKTDSTGRFAALYRPVHLIGLELGISVLNAALRGEPTGTPMEFRADVMATAKRDLSAGEILDGEGGFCVYGKLAPATASLSQGALPLGLAHGVRLRNPIPAGQVLRWQDVEVDADNDAVQVRRAMEPTVFARLERVSPNRVHSAAWDFPKIKRRRAAQTGRLCKRRRAADWGNSMRLSEPD